MPDKIKIGAVILNYNNWQDTIECAQSVLASDKRPDWLILADNASTNDSLAHLRNWINQQAIFLSNSNDPLSDKTNCKIKLLALPQNRGYAAGNNAAIKLLLEKGADLFLMLNNDVILSPAAIGKMMEAFLSKKKAGLCGSAVCYHDEPDIVQCLAGGWTNPWTCLSLLNGNGKKLEEARKIEQEKVEKNLNFIYGACVLAGKDFIEQIGLMDEGYFLYCEEQDWAFRAKGAFDLVYAKDAIVWHKEGQSTGFSRKNFSARRALRLLKSRLRLTLKFHPLALPSVCAAQIYALLRKVARKRSRKR